MFNKIKYALKVIFTRPKPRIVETEYIKEKKSWKINYDKYYTKKENFILLMWSFTLLALTFEGLAYLFLFPSSLIRFALLLPAIFFLMISNKNHSKIKEKYKKKALEDGAYG
jgi:hypothetical protein